MFRRHGFGDTLQLLARLSTHSERKCSAISPGSALSCPRTRLAPTYILKMGGVNPPSADADDDASVLRGLTPPAQRRNVYPSSDHGLRMTRARYLLASASSTNCSLTGSKRTSRLSHMQILQACTVLIDRCITV